MAITWKLTPDVPAPIATPAVRSYAWQTFIALNWPALSGQPGQPDPNKKLGDPGPTVWETFIETSNVFRPNAEPPLPWGGTKPIPASVASPARTALHQRRQFKVLKQTSKTVQKPNVIAQIAKLSEFLEAAPQTAWLTDQSGELVWYELLINQDEYNYIVKNQLYDASKQRMAMMPGGPGIANPAGETQYGPMGAIEIKAAWRVLPEDDKIKARFYTSRGVVLKDPQVGESGGYREVSLGLVGLHIIHKTPQAPQYVWATFEHVDNCPTHGQTAGSQTYSFFDKACVACPPNVAPQKGQSYSQPIQVDRVVPPSDAVVALNKQVWGLIAAAKPDSVWLNYQLVDAQWPQNGTTVPPRTKAPLTAGNPLPTILLNTTLETYIQGTTSCLSCHRSAPIASTQTGPLLAHDPNEKTPFASDYSFLFLLAEEPAASSPSPTPPAPGGK